MGFFDSMKKGFEEENKANEERRSRSRYQTVAQMDSDRYNKYASKSDGELIALSNAIYLSEEEKELAANILIERGYTKDDKGKYHR